MPTTGEILGGLDQEFAATYAKLMDKCVAAGFRIVPYDGARSPWQQAIYWRQSRTKQQVQAKIAEVKNEGAPYIAKILDEVGPHSGKHVTDAIPGQSFHQFKRAVDSYVVSPDTHKALWREEEKDGDEYELAVQLYDKMGGFAEALGLTWGGHWSFGDYGHVQGQKASSPMKEYGSWAKLDAALKAAWPAP